MKHFFQFNMNHFFFWTTVVCYCSTLARTTTRQAHNMPYLNAHSMSGLDTLAGHSTCPRPLPQRTHNDQAARTEQCVRSVDLNLAYQACYQKIAFLRYVWTASLGDPGQLKEGDDGEWERENEHICRPGSFQDHGFGVQAGFLPCL